MKPLALLFLLTGCVQSDAPAPTPAPKPTPGKSTQAKPEPTKKKAAPAAKPAGLPRSQRVFAAALHAGKHQQALGTWRDQLWAYDPATGQEMWRVSGPGVAQRVAAGDIGKGHRLYVAWGAGRDFLRVPLVVNAHDPKTGKMVETMWRFEGPRTECAHLSVADVDGDGKSELAFAHYETKYFVRPRHMKADGSVIEGPQVRMASSRGFADLNGDGKPDEVIGRVYGDAKGEMGDLLVNVGTGREFVSGVDRGVKAVAIADLDGKGARVYFADGWEANYGKSAKAQLARLSWADGKPKVERLGTSYDEFTFFGIHPVDVDGDGLLELAVRGDKRVSLFKPTASGPWARRTVAELPPVLNIAVASTAKGAFVYVPDKKATKAIPIR